MGENRPVQRPPLSLTFSGERFADPQTLTFAVILPCTVTLRRSSLSDCLLAVNTSVVQMQLPLKELTLFSTKFAFLHPLICLDFHAYPRNEKRGEKSPNQQKFHCSRRPTASSRQSAANQYRVFDPTQAISYSGQI